LVRRGNLDYMIGQVFARQGDATPSCGQRPASRGQFPLADCCFSVQLQSAEEPALATSWRAVRPL